MHTPRPGSFLLLLSLLLLLGPWAAPCRGAETHTELNKQQQAPPRKGNLFDLFFGSAPPMPTQRGILIVDAFLDSNGNHKRDAGEEDLSGKVDCEMDKVNYPLPAFIPGLSIGKDYTLACKGKEFVPDGAPADVFIERRGQIVHLDIPFRPAPPPTVPTQGPKAAAER